MASNEFNIRLLKVKEIPAKCKFNRWRIMRYHGEPLNVDIKASIIPKMDDNVLFLELGVYYKAKVDNVDTEYLRYSIALKYEIPELSKHVEMTEYSIILPSHMLPIMMSVGVGTIRGMLAKSLQNTKLRDYPLPILNITEIIHSLGLYRIPKKTYEPLFQFIYE